MIQHIICLCLLIVAAMPERQQIWIQYTDFPYEMLLQKKYFHRIKQGYFLELGGFNPIMHSNTVSRSNWKGLIVQANQERASRIRDYQPDGITSLNFALTNVSGQIITFYQHDNPVQSSANKESLEPNRIIKQLKVMTINLADLCHKYYKRRPTTMSIDLESLGQSTLRTNDWSNSKCLPDYISAEDHQFKKYKYGNQTPLAKYLIEHNYTYVDRESYNSVFIHNSKLQYYKNEAKINQPYLNKNKIIIKWINQVINIFGKLIGKSFGSPMYLPRQAPAYVQIRTPHIIDIVTINNHSNFISDVGQNRPIIILEYDEKVSSIYLGTMDYNISEITIDGYLFKKITTRHADKELLVYVFDHRKYDTFNLVILNIPTNVVNPNPLPNPNLLQTPTPTQTQTQTSSQTQTPTPTPTPTQTKTQTQTQTKTQTQTQTKTQTQTPNPKNVIFKIQKIDYRLIVILILTNAFLFCLYEFCKNLYKKKGTSKKYQNANQLNKTENDGLQLNTQ